MCFVNDYDYSVAVQNDFTYTAEKPVRCDECHRMIPIGEKVFHIDQQEYDECKACLDGDCECPRDADGCPTCDASDCQCEEPNFGETFSYDCCKDCRKFRQAIRSAETKAGCASDESEPALPAMCEQINDGGQDEALKYWREAKRMFPELLASGYLRFIWHRCF